MTNLYFRWGVAASCAGLVLAFAPELLAQAPTVVVPAPAESDGKVVIEYGSWLTKGLDLIVPILMGVIVWLMRKLPASVVAMIEMFRVEQLLKRAIDYGVNATKGAVAGARLDIPVANKVLEAAGDYAVAQAPALVEKLGGLEALLQKLLARIEVSSVASIETLNVPKPPAATAAVAAAASGSSSSG